ncbi:MAG: bestrophin family ion channel [Planctomycetota bacterium]|nr:bestrophin family ion channel [Planctomycetota bacterium]
MITRRRIDPLQVLRATAGPVALISVYAVGVVLYERETDTPLDLPIAIPAMLGTAISILLGFKTSAAYDRWWEARKIWGGIVNDSRSFGRQVVSFLRPTGPAEGPAVRELAEDLLHRHIFWVYALSRALRRESELEGAEGFLPEGELEALERSTNVPNELLDRQGRDLRRALDLGWMDTYQHVTVEGSLTRLTAHMGRCERIKNTGFPAHYGYLASRILWFFALLVPWSLGRDLIWWTIPVTIAVTMTFWMIWVIGEALADPFENRPTDTPMTSLAETIERDVRHQLGEAYTLPDHSEDGGVLM